MKNYGSDLYSGVAVLAGVGSGGLVIYISEDFISGGILGLLVFIVYYWFSRVLYGLEQNGDVLSSISEKLEFIVSDGSIESQNNEESRIEAERIAEEKAEEESRIEAERIAEEKAEEESRIEAERIAEEKAEEESRIEAERIAEEKAEEERIRLEAEHKLQKEFDGTLKKRGDRVGVLLMTATVIIFLGIFFV